MKKIIKLFLIPDARHFTAPAQNIHVNSSTVRDLNNTNDFYTAWPRLKKKIKSITATAKNHVKSHNKNLFLLLQKEQVI